MAKIAHVNQRGLTRVVVHYALKDTEHESEDVYFYTYREIVSETKNHDLIILGENIDDRGDGWKMARKLMRKKRKLLVISDSIPPKRYLKIPWVEDDRLFYKRVDLAKIVDFLLSQQ
jgi:hypothetical protein